MSNTEAEAEKVALRAEVAALRASSPDDGSGWIEWSDRIRRDALADLRAKVEALPGTGGGRLGSGFVAMPGDGDCVQRADVLALIDGDQR